MSRHYHVAKCPQCGQEHQRSCTLDNCTTAMVSRKPFTASDGHQAEAEHCACGNTFYVDYGNRPR